MKSLVRPGVVVHVYVYHVALEMHLFLLTNTVYLPYDEPALQRADAYTSIDQSERRRPSASPRALRVIVVVELAERI